MAAPATASAPKQKAPLSAEQRLARGLQRLERSQYAGAEDDLRAAAEGPQPEPARLGLSYVLLSTGRYAEAAETARLLHQASNEIRLKAAWVQAESLRRQGRLEQAEAVLRRVQDEPAARRARLLLGEVLLEMGRRADAAGPLLTLIKDYNSDHIDSSDGRGLAMVGRAAHLLRSPQDANDAFNEAERSLEGEIQTLLWRAELFLEKYDPGHAEEVIREVLGKAPNHPAALVFLAQVKLAQTLDFDSAERLARKALAVDPKFAGAHFVLAGIALRDMELGLADRCADAGLKHNPRDLDLLSMKAATRFLADDAEGFERAKRRVLALNPTYSRMFQIVGEYAEWEHRYDEIVEMMREAVVLDREDAAARATLGFNLIRAGDEQEGLQQLQGAFDRDPFNVRVYNTLRLFEQVIPEHYVSVQHGPFTIRYHREERDILDRYVPQLLDRAWRQMVEAYGFSPTTPVGVELYAERQNFSIRTSGLPNTGIQGVCFGRTLAAVSPMHETFNLGMTLWHELAHVFHIQLSRSHVPRWFTEGLAEFETLAARPEWTREHDPDLYAALRAGRVPTVTAMNRAFTRAEDLSDMATAYYASTQILVMLRERYDMRTLARMLELWGEGKRTAEVIEQILGITPAELDSEFRTYLRGRLARYTSQFVPMAHAPPLGEARRAARRAPRDAEKQTRFALAAFREGNTKLARQALAAALKVDPNYADALWLRARLARKEGDHDAAQSALTRLGAAGCDGYVVQMALAELAVERRDARAARAALTAAHQFDPSMAEPLQVLAELARKEDRTDDELEALRELARLEQHEAAVYQRLLELLVQRKLYDEARQVGEAAIYADVNGLRTHQLFASALAAGHELDRAVFELNSALLCPGRPFDKADVHAQLAETYVRAGRRAQARKHARLARELDADNVRLGKLPW
jgi:tetratricopeptide (TPR) repeat protein